MPCPCKLPPEIYPDTAEWGPLLWTLLHGLAERAGKLVSPMFVHDERMGWIQFMQSVQFIIPCPACREHFTEYIKLHPVAQDLKRLPQTQLPEYVRTWFWEVHEWVNESLKKPSFPKDQLTSTYGRVDLRKILLQFEAPMMRAIRLSGGQLVKYNDFKRYYLRLLSIYT